MVFLVMIRLLSALCFLSLGSPVAWHIFALRFFETAFDFAAFFRRFPIF
jgi:hypothetical protein